MSSSEADRFGGGFRNLGCLDGCEDVFQRLDGFDAIQVAGVFRLGFEREAHSFFLGENPLVNRVDQRAANTAAGAARLHEDDHRVARLIEGREGNDPGIVGFFAIVHGLRGSGFTGDDDIVHADFSGGASSDVDGLIHPFADEFQVAFFYARLEQIDLELGEYRKQEPCRLQRLLF